MIIAFVKFVGLSVLLYFGVIQIIAHRKVSKYWDRLPLVTGEIIESKLINFNDLDRRIYEPYICFKYQYQGEEYESETPIMNWAQIFPDKNQYHSVLSRYKVGDIVNVKVIPNSPHMAFLEVAPFSKFAAIAIPVIPIVYILFVFFIGSWAFDLLNNFDQEAHKDSYMRNWYEK